MKLRSNKGFSLVELIIVIAILGIIALIAVPNLTGIQQRSQVNADLRSAETIGKAVRIWLTDGAATGRMDTVEGKWVRYDKLSEIEQYVSIDLLPKSYAATASDGGYWVAVVSDSSTYSYHVLVAIGEDSTMSLSKDTIEAYTKGGTAGVAYAEGYTDLAAGITKLKATAEIDAGSVS